MTRLFWPGAMLAITVLALGIPGPVMAANLPGSLPAPAVTTCSSDGTTITADWTDVTGATKYSVGVAAIYDLAGESVLRGFDFGTSGRTDGAPISQSDLQITLSALIADFDTNADGIPDVLGLAPISVDLRVKALNPGHGQGRQNNVFSDFCHVLP